MTCAEPAKCLRYTHPSLNLITNSIVQIINPDGTAATGVLLNNNGGTTSKPHILVLTNSHVTIDTDFSRFYFLKDRVCCDECLLLYPDNFVRGCIELINDPQGGGLDMKLLLLPDLPANSDGIVWAGWEDRELNYPPVALPATYNNNYGFKQLFIAGYVGRPLALTAQGGISDNIYAASNIDNKFVLLDAFADNVKVGHIGIEYGYTAPGMSGSPVFNERGYVQELYHGHSYSYNGLIIRQHDVENARCLPQGSEDFLEKKNGYKAYTSPLYTFFRKAANNTGGYITEYFFDPNDSGTPDFPVKHSLPAKTCDRCRIANTCEEGGITVDFMGKKYANDVNPSRIGPDFRTSNYPIKVCQRNPIVLKPATGPTSNATYEFYLEMRGYTTGPIQMGQEYTFNTSDLRYNIASNYIDASNTAMPGKYDVMMLCYENGVVTGGKYVNDYIEVVDIYDSYCAQWLLEYENILEPITVPNCNYLATPIRVFLDNNASVWNNEQVDFRVEEGIEAVEPAILNAGNGAEILNGSRIGFYAGKYIHLKNNFHVAGSSHFHAKIEDCDRGVFRTANPEPEASNAQIAASTQSAATTTVSSRKTSTTTSAVVKPNKVEFTAYPNPNYGKNVVFKYANGRDYSVNVSIYNGLGEEVKQFKLLYNTEKEINLSDLTPGIYMCKMSGNDEAKTLKLMVER